MSKIRIKKVTKLKLSLEKIKGKKGEIIKVLKSSSTVTVIVEGVNISKKHNKKDPKCYSSRNS